jgi:hypothetical protein
MAMTAITSHPLCDERQMSSTAPSRHYLVSSTAHWCHISIMDRRGTTVATWTLGGAGSPDLAVVDRIARLQLEAKGRGQTIVLSRVSPDLEALIRLAGLDGVLATQPG